ncbi:MAG: hypothetical protein AABX60_02195 [Nanoarchaeota archaeon]
MVVFDSSSLILLAKIGILEKLISNLREKAIISDEVYKESTSKKEAFDAKLIENFIEEKRITKQGVKDRGLCQRVRKDFNFGEGEAEAIALCLESGASLITDDKKAINACKLLKIRFTTAGKLLIRLYKKGLITKMEAEACLKRLEKFGRYSSEIMRAMMEELK